MRLRRAAVLEICDQQSTIIIWPYDSSFILKMVYTIASEVEKC